jgi:hypothetical protein
MIIYYVFFPSEITSVPESDEETDKNSLIFPRNGDTLAATKSSMNLNNPKMNDDALPALKAHISL